MVYKYAKSNATETEAAAEATDAVGNNVSAPAAIPDYDYEEYELILQATPLRTAPIYTAYFNWSRLIVLGIIPFVMLVYLNTKIYQDIKARRNRRLNARHQQKKLIKVRKRKKKKRRKVINNIGTVQVRPSL